MTEKYNVMFNDTLVGEMFLSPEKKMCFKYDSNWIRNGFSLNPISLPLNDSVFVPNNFVFNGLFGVFNDSLPDSWGRLLLKRLSRKNTPELEFLRYTNKLSSGALTYVPKALAKIEDYNLEELDKMSKEAEGLLKNEETGLDFLIANGYSSGGARPKCNIKFGNDYYLVKFNSHLDGEISGYREYKYSLCAKRCGIIMPETKLLPSKLNKGYFATQRFDFKEDGTKIHMVSVAGLLEFDFNSPALDYLDLIKLAKYLTNNSKEDLLQMFRLMCFNVFAHNLDDHGKNFAFLYDDDNMRWYVSPAYDLTYSNTYYDEHTTSVNGKGKDISDSDLLAVGLTSGINKKVLNDEINNIKNIVFTDLKEFL